MKCEHGSYIPSGETVALYCKLCNPDGVPDGPEPHLPRRADDMLNGGIVDAVREMCPGCGCVRVYSRDTCPTCGRVQEAQPAGREMTTANPRPLAGACPKCGSLIHYEVKKSKWLCADCGHEYKAPRPNRLAEPHE